MTTDALQLRDNARRELEQIRDLETGIDYLNKVRAIETWARAEKKDAQLQNIIAEQKLRTQRILGRLIDEGQKKGEVRKQSDSLMKGPVIPLGNNGKSLEEIGITPKQSHVFQQIAKIPDDRQIINLCGKRWKETYWWWPQTNTIKVISAVESFEKEFQIYS